MIVAIFSYLSIEMIAVAAGEAAQPKVAIRQAFRSTVLRLILFYMLTLALMMAIVPWTSAGTNESPFVKVMQAVRIPAAAGVINFVILVAALSAMNSQLYVTTRMMFSLSRAGYAPRSLGVINRRGVPLNALLLSTAGSALAAVLNVTSRVPAVRSTAIELSHGGVPGDDVARRGPDDGSPADYGFHRAIPHDADLWCAVPGMSERCLLDLVSRPQTAWRLGCGARTVQVFERRSPQVRFDDQRV